MTFPDTLQAIRTRLSYWWILIATGAIFIVSQTTIGLLVEAIGPLDIIRLQVTESTASGYLATFHRWEAEGLMPFYRAHFIIDGVHWIWYTLLLLTMLSLALTAANAPRTWNALLLLPIIAGPCDALENTIQQVFLSDPGYATIGHL